MFGNLELLQKLSNLQLSRYIDMYYNTMLIRSHYLKNACQVISRSV